MANKKKWTQREEETLVQAVSANPYNLSKCFISVATELGRTELSVRKRWYQYTKFTEAGRTAIFTLGKGSTYGGGKNFYSGCRMEPAKKVRSASLWARLLKILRFK